MKKLNLLMVLSVILILTFGCTSAPAEKAAAPADSASKAEPAVKAEPAAVVEPTVFPVNFNFEKEPVGAVPAGWIVVESDDKAILKVVTGGDVGAYSAPNCLYMEDESESKSAMIAYNFGGPKEKGVIGCAFYIPSAKPGDLYITVQKADGYSDRAVDVLFSAGNNIKYRVSEKQKELGKYKMDQWNYTEIFWDSKTKKAMIYLNGALVSEQPLNKGVVPDRLVIKMGSSDKTGKAGYVDNIGIKLE